MGCAKEEARKGMSARPAISEIKRAVPSPSRNVDRSAGKLLSGPKVRGKALKGQCNSQQAVLMWAHVVTGTPFDSRESLEALKAIKHLMELEPAAANELRAVNGFQRALCYLRSGVKDALPSEDERQRNRLAAEIEKACFDSKSALEKTEASMLSDYPLGATFAATERMGATEEESTSSKTIGDLPQGSLCCVLAHGRTPGSNRLLLEWE